MINEGDLEEVKKLLDSAESKIRQAKTKLFANEMAKKAIMLNDAEEGDVIQGVFDGQQMIGNDKKIYQVPANYASKSKLIPGDVLKLTISEDGKFVYKQIGPVDRKNVIGALEEVGDGEYQVDVEGKKYKVLLASITYFKAKTGDQLSIVIPAEGESDWAAVDNII
jgi:hypothetical protein